MNTSKFAAFKAVYSIWQCFQVWAESQQMYYIIYVLLKLFIKLKYTCLYLLISDPV